jgi:hypothetical protein
VNPTNLHEVPGTPVENQIISHQKMGAMFGLLL